MFGSREIPFEVAVSARPEPSLTEDAARWDAVCGRDPRADGAFVFAVRTTGVYCRPSCPSRAANRANVSFHDTPDEARRLGFRACRRCRPDDAPEDRLVAQAVKAAARLIEEAIADERPIPQLAALADRVGFSAFHFHRMFKRALGVTPKSYAAQLRSRRLETEMGAGVSVTEAIHAAGYSSSSRFYETASARLGMAAKARRFGGEGETIQRMVCATSLGPLLVAATGRGVCAIAFGESAPALEADLKARFPKAAMAEADPDFDSLVRQVVALVEEPRLGHGLPLDIRGTAFQERVWKALRDIPIGRTASYSEIAASIGKPTASRGVAQACAANPAAVAIPCHRVVRADGALSGYRWGVERKTALLKREGAL